MSVICDSLGGSKPKALGSCPKKIITPIPAVKPAITGIGTNRLSFPNPNMPLISCIQPANKPIIGNAASPCFSTTLAIKTDMAAAGPLTAKGVPPNKAQTIPAITAVIKPTPGGTPEASAIANDKGIATKATVIPAIKSAAKYLGEKSAFHSGSNLERPRSSRISL